ncbi:amidase [Gordonia jinhuaensis]|uniref:amidase n=1 Tax=Gordonia jinhuaensis TaxID=1517702 RepID=A0A916T6S5_9ACTN|nr:putative amidase AmiC [Gordonia jinhuaensis]
MGVAAAIAAGDVSRTEVLEAALARIDAVEPELHAVAVDDRSAARHRDRGTHTAAGCFAGVPSVIKNNTAVAGIPTLHGSRAVPATPATHDEPFTTQFRATGATIVAASTLPAFGLTASTEFVDREPTRNPWDTDRSAGASSGGSAALVAAGAVPLAQGNDGGGSIRIPAAACGLVGLKPTRGRLAAAPQSRSMPIDLVCEGVLTRTVRDTARFLAEVERFAPARSLPRIGRVEAPSSRRLRIAVFTDPITGPLDADTRLGLSQTVSVLESLGHRLDPVDVPVGTEFVDQFTLYWGLMGFGIDHLGARLFGAGFDRTRLDPFTRELSRLFARNFYRLPTALRGLRRANARFLGLFADHDVILSPTLAHTPPPLGHLSPAGDFDTVFERLVRFLAFTPINNTSGAPGISLPLAWSATGVPIGMHFSARPGDERTLLEVAYELEEAVGVTLVCDARCTDTKGPVRDESHTGP